MVLIKCVVYVVFYYQLYTHSILKMVSFWSAKIYKWLFWHYFYSYGLQRRAKNPAKTGNKLTKTGSKKDPQSLPASEVTRRIVAFENAPNSY